MSGVVFQNIIAVANASQDFVFALLCALVGVFSVCVVTLSVVLAKRVNGDRKRLERYVYERKTPDKTYVCENSANIECVVSAVNKKARHGKKNKSQRRQGSVVK